MRWCKAMRRGGRGHFHLSWGGRAPVSRPLDLETILKGDFEVTGGSVSRLQKKRPWGRGRRSVVQGEVSSSPLQLKGKRDCGGYDVGLEIFLGGG